MFTVQRKTSNVNEPETVVNNKGSTDRGGKQECNNINEPETASNSKGKACKRSKYKENEKKTPSVSMNQRSYSVTRGEPTSVHNTKTNVQWQCS